MLWSARYDAKSFPGKCSFTMSSSMNVLPVHSEGGCVKICRKRVEVWHVHVCVCVCVCVCGVWCVREREREREREGERERERESVRGVTVRSEVSHSRILSFIRDLPSVQCQP